MTAGIQASGGGIFPGGLDRQFAAPLCGQGDCLRSPHNVLNGRSMNEDDVTDTYKLCRLQRMD